MKRRKNTCWKVLCYKFNFIFIFPPVQSSKMKRVKWTHVKNWIHLKGKTKSKQKTQNQKYFKTKNTKPKSKQRQSIKSINHAEDTHAGAGRQHGKCLRECPGAITKAQIGGSGASGWWQLLLQRRHAHRLGHLVAPPPANAPPAAHSHGRWQERQPRIITSWVRKQISKCGLPLLTFIKKNIKTIHWYQL